MSDEEFVNRLRTDAQQLRYEPADDAVWARLAARIDERVRTQPTVAQLLAIWFRPVAASFAIVSVVAALSLTWIEQPRETSTVESVVAAGAPSTDVGDALGVE